MSTSLNHTAEPSAATLARAWRETLPEPLRRSSLWRGGLIFGINAVLYIALFIGAFWLPNFWLRTACILALPMTIGALFVIGHDAGHSSLIPQGWLNRLVGRLSMLPAWHPYTSWTHAHNTLHHGGTNLRGRHPDFVPLTKQEYDRLPRWRKALERVYRSPLGVSLSYVIEFYGGYLLFPRPEHRSPFKLGFHLDRLLILAFLALQITVGWFLVQSTPNLATHPAIHVAMVVFGPWLIWIWFMGFVSYIQHTHPRLAWYDDREEWSFYHVQLKSTTHVVFPWPIERMLNNIMDHAAHHIDPTIPLYHLPESQKLLEDACQEHAVVVPWTPSQYLETCRSCKLYDFKRHCWTDFEGKATSPQGLPWLAFATENPLPFPRIFAEK